MELQDQVQRWLAADEQCVQSTKVSLLADGGPKESVLGLVTRAGDKALFIFQFVPNVSLKLDQVLPIRGSFTVSLVSSSPGNTVTDLSTLDGIPDGSILKLHILSDVQSKVISEVRWNAAVKLFVRELKKSIEAYRQVAHLVGIPGFSWLDKYKQQINTSIGMKDTCTWIDFLLDDSVKPTQDVGSTKADVTDSGLDPFGMPNFDVPLVSPAPIHKTPSSGSLLEEGSDKTISSSPALPRRRNTLPTTVSARDGFIKLYMEQRESEFINIVPFTFLVGTWNVNGQSASESVGPWIGADKIPPDVIVVGFQELDLTAGAVITTHIISTTINKAEEDWIKVVERGLPANAHYTKVKSLRLVGIFLLVYIQTKHMGHVKEVEAESVPTGIMGMVGNKGGVAIRVVLHNTSICFVNSHLAAHQELYERRNQDYNDILNKLAFSGTNETLSIVDHDIVFWLGDLNYRINDMDAGEVKRLIEKKNLAKLLELDQLKLQMGQRKCFAGFEEGFITFVPTYKYDPGTDNWDSSEKGRSPAWCDRVLWRGDHVKQIKYRSHPQLKLSDHKPVSSLFEIGIKVVNVEKEKIVFEEVVRTLDKHENESLPQVKLSTTEIVFNDVEFMEKKTQIISIENTGQFSAQFAFIAKLDDNAFCKPWLSIKPAIGFITPGSIRQVKMIVYVDKETAAALNSGDDKIDDILVLHLEGGKDFFITVTGNYKPSVFGSSLEALAHMYGPIRDVPVAQLVDLEHGVDIAPATKKSSLREPLEVPKELWLLVDHLYKFGINEEDILKQSGFQSDHAQIRAYLDSGNTGEMPGSIHSIAEALLIFLEALPEPVIPFAFHNRALECCNNFVLCKQVIAQLPQCHKNAFTYLAAFLRELLLYSERNKLDAKTLATVFGTIFLRSERVKNSSESVSRRAMNQLSHKKARFLYHFLVNEYNSL